MVSSVVLVVPLDFGRGCRARRRQPAFDKALHNKVLRPVAQLDSASVFGWHESPFRKTSRMPAKRGISSSCAKLTSLLKCL